MNSTESSSPPVDDKLAQLQRKMRNYRPLHPFYTCASLLCISIGGASSIIRYRNGWSYEEAGLWSNLGFWGGYILGVIILVPVMVWGLINDWSFDRAMQEFEKERARRGLEPRGECAISVLRGGGKLNT